VAGFYYVDESAAGSTDSGNPYGTPGLPRRTIPNNLPAGSVVELRGTYTRNHTSPNDLKAAGTLASPVFVRGASSTNRPRATGTMGVLNSTYLIIENIEFVMGGSEHSVFLAAPVSNVAVRHCELRGNLNAGGMGLASFTSARSQNIVIWDNKIHDNGDVNATYDQDVHGITLGNNQSNVWIVDNELHGNSGDGVQINSSGTSDHVYLGRNVAHDNKQTGLSSKQATDVIFSQNHVYSHRASNSSNGACLGFQYNPERIWFILNELHDCDYGIAGESDLVPGGQSVYVVGNLIYRIHTTTAFNPNTGWQHAGVRLTGGTNRFLVNNTFHDVDSGISSPGNGNLNIHNNVISNVTRGSHVFVENLATATASTIGNNLFEGTVRLKWGSNTPLTLPVFQSQTGKCAGCQNASPAYVDAAAGDFSLQSSSPAINAGVVHGVYATFQSLYGLDIRRDVAGLVRPSGPAFDMGAHEYAAGGAVVPELSVVDTSAPEGNSGSTSMVFTVSLSQASALTVSVPYATANSSASAGSDYTAASGTLTFSPGQVSRTVSVSVLGDTSVEPDESFFLELGTPSAAATVTDGQGRGTILNDDSAAPTVSVNDVSVTEGQSGTVQAIFTASLSASSTQTVTVAFATANATALAGSDYVASSGTLTFSPGTTSRTIAVTVNGDTTVEPSETFAVNLSSPVGATLADAQGIGTIATDDSAALPTISIADISGNEGQSGVVGAVFAVALSAATTQPVSITYATANGTATSGSDYAAVSGTFTIPAGSTNATITVLVNGDTTVEASETFFVNLSAPTGATLADAQAVGTILNDDSASGRTLSIDDVSVNEGHSGVGQAVFTARLSSASTQTVTVAFSTANGTALSGTDYNAASGTIAFPPGSTTMGVFVAVNGDTAVEPSETFAVNLSAPVGATIADAQAIATIVNDDSAAVPTLTINDVSLNEGHSGAVQAVFTARLSTASTQTVTAAFATANGTALSGSDYSASSGTVTFPAGSTTASVTVAVNGDTAVEPNETFAVNLSAPVGATLTDAQGIGTILNDDTVALPALTIDDVTVNEGPSGVVSAVFTARLSASSAQTVTVAYATANGTASSGSDYVAASGTISFSAGSTTRTVTVSVNGDATAEPNETFVVNLSAPVGATLADAQGIGTIVNFTSSAQPVVWSALVGVSAAANDLSKTAGTGWNAGAVSSKAIASGDGFAELSASELTTKRFFGLNKGNNDPGYGDIDFGLYLNLGELRVYENGAERAIVGSYATGDSLRVAVEGGVVKYRKNGALLYSSPVAPAYPLLVDSSLYTTGATLNDVVLSGTLVDSFPAGEAVVWTALVGASASGNDLTKTAATGWNAGAVSTRAIASGNGFVELTASELTTKRIVGLNKGNTGPGYGEIDFALYLNLGELRVYENGVERAIVGSYATGDSLRVAIESGVVKYRKNGALLYTSAVAPAYPLLVDTSLYTTGATVNDVVLSGTLQ
jgi:hypothetical protein